MTTSSSSLLCPLVGDHFYPPAKQLLSASPSGLRLRLMPEPDNPYDGKAIRVLCQLAETFPARLVPQLAEALDGTGFDVHDLMQQGEPLHLGYIADSDGKALRRSGAPGNREVALAAEGAGVEVKDLEAELRFNPEGLPEVWISLADKAEGEAEA